MFLQSENETYERILLAIDMGTSAGKLTQQALVWLVAALQPLQLSEIMEALSIKRRLDSDIGLPSKVSADEVGISRVPMRCNNAVQNPPVRSNLTGKGMCLLFSLLTPHHGSHWNR
jgi:hypothetical protein